MVRSFCSAPAVLKSRDVGQKRQPEAENALVVGDFRHAPTTHGLHERATLRTPRFNAREARRRVWRLLHEQMNGRDALGSTAAKPRSQGERKRERILIDQANMLVRRYLCTVFFGRRLRLCVSRWSAFFGTRKQFELYEPCSISRMRGMDVAYAFQTL